MSSAPQDSSRPASSPLARCPWLSRFGEATATLGALSAGEWLALTFGIIGAHLTVGYNYLLFHTGVEFFTACVCFNIFLVLSSTSDISRNNFLTIVGVAYVFVGVIDLLHALAFKGMPIFTDYDYYSPQLWIAARYLESGAVVIGLLALTARRHVSAAAVLSACLLATCGFLLAIFYTRTFPVCFIPGKGLTPFKIGSEFVIIALDFVALALLHRRRALFEADVFRLLRMSLVAAAAMELCFCFYDAPNMDDALSEAGHVIKLFAFYVLYKAIVVGSVRNPLVLVAQELRDSEKRLRSAMAAAGLTYVEVDPVHGKVRRAENFAEVMGYQSRVDGAEECMVELLAHVPPEDQPRVVQAQTLRLPVIEARVIGDDGQVRWIESSAAIPEGEGARRAFVTILDVTARVRAREQLLAAKSEAERADRAKSKFLAAASHDLRQPVQALMLYLAMMGRHTRDLPRAAETVKHMQAALDSLSNLLTSILDISRLDAGVIAPNAEPVDLAGMIARLSGEYAAKAAQRGLKFRAVAPTLAVRADAILLERALRNLIENALRYTPEGGVLLGARRRGARVRIDVIDSGVGVAPGRTEDIFQEFVQLDNPGRDMNKGLGLGLAIVARVARLMDGAVELVSAPGRGSRFSLTLPACAPPAAPAAAQPEPRRPGQGRVLIVEDNSIVREGLERMLQEWGYQTATAENGEAALALVEAEGPFALRLLDYSLGQGISGLSAAQRLAQVRPAPTIILTGDTARERIAEIAASGFAMLHKPVTSQQLRAALEGLLHRDAGEA
ncbi:signal transduction histidine kinase [Rhodoblastus acidophilus]|uniref:MASE3 domain-containing protein n=1 Tax=Rhodoblastus acidophilus TaxID=1074 RepID=UPI002223FFBE|nr:signal transduction histidine kinase [Rhodoblastus acidophilus]